MRLLQASRFFDKTTLRDAYTNVALFKGQISAYIDSQVDGSISRRRVVSLDPSITIPARRALKYNNEVWLLGDSLKDNVQNVTVRASYAATRGTDLYLLLTPGQAALGTTAGIVSAYGQAQYQKSTVNPLTEARYDSQYTVTFSVSETIPTEGFLETSGVLYHVRGSHSVLEGFKVVEVDQLDSARISVTVNTGSYVPITDTFETGSTTTTGLTLDPYQAYKYSTESAPKFVSGDQLLIVAASTVTPVNGQTVTISGTNWRVISHQSMQDAWKLLIRRT